MNYSHFSVSVKSGVALAAVAAALAGPATADARAHMRHHHHARTGSTVSSQLRTAQNEIAEMRQQISALQAQMGQASAGGAGAASQAAAPAFAAAQSAQATADAAVATANHAVAVADSAKADTGKVSKGLDLVKWAGNTQISGRAYLNASSITQHYNGAAGTNTNSPNSGIGLNIKRMYISIDHKFSPVFSGDFTTDISNVVGQTSNQNFAAGAAPGLVGRGLYVKKAYLQAKIDPALWVRLGAADMPWIPYSEGNYNYRHIENTLIDRLNFGTSADWGVHVGGDLGKGLISYQVSAVDGAGYRNVKVTKYIDLEGRVSAQYDGFYAAVGGYTGKRGNDVQVASNAVGPTTFRTARRWDAAVGFQNKMFGLGGEYFYAKNWNNVTVNPATNALSQDSANGWSVFGNFNATPHWSAFARYDEAKPNKITDPALKDRYFNVGIQWEPVKIVDLALVYKRETVKNGAVNTSNGVIGCATSPTANSFGSLGAQATGTCAGNGTYDEIGVFSQIRF